MSERRMGPDEVAAIRHRVKAAFRELARVGFLTKTNFSCCMTCAVAELQEIAETRRRNRAVYWHRQDEEHFRKGGALYIRFCYLPPRNIENGNSTTRIETEIGEQVAAALRKTGLEFDWNGNPNTTICVTGVSSQSPSDKEGRNGG